MDPSCGPSSSRSPSLCLTTNINTAAESAPHDHAGARLTVSGEVAATRKAELKTPQVIYEEAVMLALSSLASLQVPLTPSSS